MVAFSNYKLKALLLDESEDYINDIKRLALMFDEIILPPISIPILKNNNRISKKVGNALIVNGLNFNDIGEMNVSPFGQLHKGLNSIDKELISAFQEISILNEVAMKDYFSFKKKINNYEYIKNQIILLESQDELFLELNNTKKQELTEPWKTQGSIIVTDQQGKPDIVHILSLPQAFNSSSLITDFLCLSNQLNCAPVIITNRFSKLMNYRYQQYKKGLKILDSINPGIMSANDFKTFFGQLTFTMSYNLFPAEIIASKTADDIIKYRNAMQNSKKQCLSYLLHELHLIIQDNPWSEKTKLEIENFVQGKLSLAILEYTNESKRIWEKLFGRLLINISEITRASVIGGSVGGIIGKLIPNSSTLEMALLGVLVSVIKESPKITQTIVDTILDFRKKKTNAIAYIANFA